MQMKVQQLDNIGQNKAIDGFKKKQKPAKYS